MSGHSKWSTIKRKKAAIDAKKGKVWTKLLREITVSARMGGGDPGANPRLRAAVIEARGSNVPSDTIDRAIKKGSGELEGVHYEEITYEGYGPGGVALLVEAITDNRNRTVSEVRHLFAKHGGNLGESGSVAWMFKRRGYFGIERRHLSEEEFMDLALELGAEDVVVGPDLYEIYTTADEFNRVREALEARGVPPAAKELAWLPQNYVELAEERSGSVLRLMEALEDHDDVQNVWANFDLDEKLLAAASSG
jgi:YebC/PmpR family DNA-binding regulatory protein